MAVAAVTRFAPVVTPGAVAVPFAGSHPKMEIVPEGQDPFIVPFAPVDGQYDGWVPGWASVDRGGTTPLLLRASESLNTVAYDLVIAYPDFSQSIESILVALRKIAAKGNRLRVKLDAASAANQWRLTAYSEAISGRQHGTNQPTRAVCSLTFTEASDPVTAVGPVSGGAGQSSSSGGGKGKGKGGGGSSFIPATYTVKKGDTLQSIAKQFYGTTAEWRKIADLNKIKDPNALKVGQILKMPLGT